ncbi:redoxin domain-containing protein [Thiohalobacter sp. IOR34]|uniref:redoxin domain-containing protein n=1 Tax=Thiohalobacter sp. IOR34 TaxID=3057176 RepID=UPI0025AF6499|nr:redoxin domain-containing protein [Thiohalobacter sp. IOR34]WJW75352.1 redoxin domain-containing protein [Thiohalobacter sp. IOR34]
MAAPRWWLAESYAGVVESRQGQPFILAFWSLDCPPCYRELAMWAELKRRHPGLDLVLVSTDGPAAAAEVEALLAELGLEWAAAWLFSEPHSQRLRHAVDPAWRGELPRTYYLRAGRVERAVSGLPQRGFVEAWLKGP